MKKTSVSSNSLGTFLSPQVPNYSENIAFYNKGWSSERVPHPSTTSGITARRHMTSASALPTPFYSGRTLPSKWEDAERWICSPVASYPATFGKNCSTNSQFVEKRRQKSKSGPIVPPPLALSLSSSSSAIGCYHYSPIATAAVSEMRAVEAPPGSIRGLVVGSPFSTGVLEADRVFRGSVGGAGDGHGYGWMDLVSESSSSSSKDEKTDDIEEAERAVSRVVSRRDMATQMSPEATSPNQSPTPVEGEASSQYPSPALVLSVIDPPPIDNSCKTEVKEVKVDKRARMTKRPKNRQPRETKREPPEVDDVYISATDAASASSWDITVPTMRTSRSQREEAKITAWENLQKAKAEAAIRKLEVKLEKKKSESMDKIMNKLQTAQLKARDMRSSISSKQESQTSKRSNKITHLVRRHTFMNSFLSCFAPRADCRTSSSSV